jgi:hypothetical protein
MRRIKFFTSHLRIKSSWFLPNPALFRNNRTRPYSIPGVVSFLDNAIPGDGIIPRERNRH